LPVRAAAPGAHDDLSNGLIFREFVGILGPEKFRSDAKFCPFAREPTLAYGAKVGFEEFAVN
jgi:hypothetical protein